MFSEFYILFIRLSSPRAVFQPCVRLHLFILLMTLNIYTRIIHSYQYHIVQHRNEKN